MAPGGCCTVPPPPSDYEGKGKEELFDGLDVYTVGSTAAASAVVFIADIYGWKVPQTRYLADKIAAHGHYVVVPDTMHGDFYESSDPNDEYADLKEYLPKHPMNVSREEAERVVKHVKGALGFRKVGMIGNCRGAKVVVGLLYGDKGVDAAVLQHPSLLELDEIKEVKVPLAILGAEIDIITPPALAKECEEILKASPHVGDKSYVRIFPGVEHGWTTRYDLKDESAVHKAMDAHDEVIAWFAKYLA